MKKIYAVVQTTGFCLFVFYIYGVIWNWPFVLAIDEKSPAIVYAYFFGTWALAIVILAVMSVSYYHSQSRHKKDIEL